MSPPLVRRRRLAGPVQQLVLAALVRLGPDAPVMTVHRHVEWRSGHWLAPQQVYTALDRMVACGWVTSWSREPACRSVASWRRRGPRFPHNARRFVSVTTAGRRALRLAAVPCDRLRWGLPGLGHEDRLYRHDGGPLYGRRLSAEASAEIQRQVADWVRRIRIQIRRSGIPDPPLSSPP